MKQTTCFLSLIYILSLGLWSCGKNGPSSTSSDTSNQIQSSNQSILGSGEEAKRKASLIAGFVVDLTGKGFNYSNLVTTKLGGGLSTPINLGSLVNSFPSGLFGGSSSSGFSGINAGNIASQMCVTPEVISLDFNNLDVIFHLNCKEVTGPVELKQVIDAGSGDVLRTIITDLAFLDKGGNEIGSMDSTTFITTNSSNEIKVNGTYVDEFTKSGSTLQATGEFEVTFTPDNPSDPKSGDVVINSTTHFTIEGTDLGDVVITSQDLHVSKCGFDAGSINIDLSGKENITITFNGCGKPVVSTGGSGSGNSPFPLPLP